MLGEAQESKERKGKIASARALARLKSPSLWTINAWFDDATNKARPKQGMGLAQGCWPNAIVLARNPNSHNFQCKGTFMREALCTHLLFSPEGGWDDPENYVVGPVVTRPDRKGIQTHGKILMSIQTLLDRTRNVASKQAYQAPKEAQAGRTYTISYSSHGKKGRSHPTKLVRVKTKPTQKSLVRTAQVLHQ